MTTKKWPHPPVIVDCFTGQVHGAGWNDWHMVELKPETCCKHGAGECETCGTTDRRDYKHKTVGGKGAVARIPARRT